MKKIIAFVTLIIFTSALSAQIIPINDIDKDEIYGYIIFQIVEKVDRKETSYLANLLDINLNRVAQFKFTDQSYVKIGNVHYNGNSIYFEVFPQSYWSGNVDSRKFSYRLYDIATNTISPRHQLPVTHKKLFVRGSYPIPGKGFGIITRNMKSRVSEYFAVSNTNQVLYKAHPYGNPKKKKAIEHISVGDIKDNLMISINSKYPKPKSKDITSTLHFIDNNTGKISKELSFDDNTYNISLIDVQIIDDKVFVFGDSYEKNKDFPSGKTAGMFKAVLDLEGNILDQKTRIWTDFQSKIDIKEGGNVRRKGFVYTHNYVYDKKTKHTIVVGEYIRGSLSSVSVEDMVFFDFDEDFNLVQVFEVPTTKSQLKLQGIKFGGSRGYGSILKSYNYFDYRFSNILNEDGGLSFFYFNTEKVRLFSRDYSHGMVVYNEGTFTLNKLKWEASTWKTERLNLLPSKPGYILLSKVNNKQILETRLERLEY